MDCDAIALTLPANIPNPPQSCPSLLLPRPAKPRGWEGGTSKVILCMSWFYATAKVGVLSFSLPHFGHFQTTSSFESIISGGK
jgi:hypothetical protein